MRADRDLTKLKSNEVLLLCRRLRALRAEATDLGLRWLLAKAELYLLYAERDWNLGDLLISMPSERAIRAHAKRDPAASHIDQVDWKDKCGQWAELCGLDPKMH